MAFLLLGVYVVNLRLRDGNYLPEVVNEYLVLHEVLTGVYCCMLLIQFGWLLF